MAAAAAGKKGDDLVLAAEKKLKAFNPFGMFGSKFEDAGEIYDKAAAQYKIAGDWDKAGDAYFKAAENAEKNKDEHDACSKYTEAGKAYKKSNPKAAVRMFATAVTLHQESNRFSQAAKLYKEIGVLHQEQEEWELAIKALNEAATCYKGEEQPARANQILLEVADICCDQHNYKQAAGIYEQVSKGSVDSATIRHSVKDYLFKASLCHLVLGSKDEDMSNLEKKLDIYKDMLPMFETSAHCKLVEACMAAFEDNDANKFTEHVYKFDQIYHLQTVIADMLLMVKQALTHVKDHEPETDAPAAGGGGDSGNDSDDDGLGGGKKGKVPDLG